MRLEQKHWNAHNGWQCTKSADALRPQIVLVFCDIQEPMRSSLMRDLRQFYPDAEIVGCSSAGEIWDDLVHTDSLCATAIEFEKTLIEVHSVSLRDVADCKEAGKSLAQNFSQKGLRHCIILSDGLHVEVNALIEGLYSVLPESVSITGGLAGDSDRFRTTWTYAHDRNESDRIVAIGLYGENLRISSGSVGGWDPFGPERIITRSQGNILYELDGQPALALYEKYLGDYAADLPASGLLFPLSLSASQDNPGLVRTILGFDRTSQSLTFAGEMPSGCCASLMKADFDRLVEGAASAAKSASGVIDPEKPSLSLLISCVGRRLVLHQRIDEEIEAVRGVTGAAAALTGFYSYGEIAPSSPGKRCELHNQTMTITTIQEA